MLKTQDSRLKSQVGITATVPVEVIYAAGMVPVDLNNLLMGSTDPVGLVQKAERAGFPISCCAWVKGIYSVVKEEGIERVVGVTEGDCADTKALLEILRLEGVETIPFGYPQGREREALQQELERLMVRFGTNWEAVERMRERLDSLRGKVHEIDRLAWEEGKVSSSEGHYYQVSCSDMKGDPHAFEAEVAQFLEQARERTSREDFLRLGFVGVPPILTDLHDFLEENGARVVYHEMQRQFSMPNATKDIVEQYLAYTYPYDMAVRLVDIREQVRLRRVEALIHYVQAFCYRAIHDIILRREMDLPILTLEADYPGRLDGHQKVRVEAFLDMVRAKRVQPQISQINADRSKEESAKSA